MPTPFPDPYDDCAGYDPVIDYSRPGEPPSAAQDPARAGSLTGQPAAEDAI